MAMLDHVSLPVSDVELLGEFYDRVLAPLGLKRQIERPGSIGFGADEADSCSFWLLERTIDSSTPGRGLHVSFVAPSRNAVDQFHRIGLENDAEDAGLPGLRPIYSSNFYGAFLFDLDGFKIEATHRS